MKDIFLVDVDDTVLDFHAVSALALRVAFEENGIEWKEELETSFRVFNGELWAALERKELARDTLMKERFPRFFAHMGMKEVDGERVNESFIRYISTHPRFIKGAENFLKELEKMGSVYFVTNGTKEIQKSRFDIIQLWKYAKQTFVSQEVGYDKPAKEYTDYVKANGLPAALEKYSNITDAEDVAMIKTFYDMFVRKAPFSDFVETLAAMKSVNSH